MKTIIRNKKYKIALIIFLSLSLVFLCSCERVIITEKDELSMNKWQKETESSEIITLEFFDDNAKFTVEKDGKKSLVLYGLCVLDDEKFFIVDRETHTPFEFFYELRGDGVFLTFEENCVTLDKL